MVLAIDIGGTKLAAAIVREDGTLVAKGRVPTEIAKGPAAGFERLLALCQQLLKESGVTLAQLPAVGVGCAGPLDIARGMTADLPNLPGWENFFPVVATLSRALCRPVFLDNDANAAAMGEHRFGAGRGYLHLIYLTLSTGLGGGVILDGRIYRGANGNAAELGHLSVAYDGWPCPCGSRGCLEAFASGENIARRARVAWGRPTLSTADVVELVRANDARAVKLWDETMQVLGAGVAGMINAFNPQRVIIGGGVTQAGDVLFDPLRRIALSRAMKPMAAVCDLVPAQLGADVVVLGAAAVAFSAVDPQSAATSAFPRVPPAAP